MEVDGFHANPRRVFHFVSIGPAREGISRAGRQVPEGASCVRAYVRDAQGHRAWTNPIFPDK